MKQSQKKKIIYMVTKGHWGGAQKYVFDLATSLPKEQFDVSVIIGQGEALPEKLHEKGVRVFRVLQMRRDISLFKELSSFRKILNILRRERPDIVHLNSSKAGGLGALAARIAGVKKIVFTAHGWYFNEPVNKLKKATTAFLSWLTVLFSTDVIVMSIENLRQANGFPLVRNKFFLIYNGIKKIDFKDRKSTRKFISGVTGVDVKKIWAVTISELHQNKGVEYFIKALPSLKDEVVFFVMGGGEERENLEELVKKFNLEKNVFLMDFVDEAARHLKAFDLFSLTSLKEGHPYTLLEAGLAGLPVIGSNIPGIRDVIDKETGILVPPKNSREIKRWLDVLINNKKKMALLGANLKKKVLKEFSFEKSFREVLKVYTE